jgi:hypothetical protein
LGNGGLGNGGLRRRGRSGLGQDKDGKAQECGQEQQVTSFTHHLFRSEKASAQGGMVVNQAPFFVRLPSGSHRPGYCSRLSCDPKCGQWATGQKDNDCFHTIFLNMDGERKHLYVFLMALLEAV